LRHARWHGRLDPKLADVLGTDRLAAYRLAAAGLLAEFRTPN